MRASVTLLYGGLLGLFVFALSLNVSRLRGKHKVFVGDALPPEVMRASRAHGNSVEHVPLTLLLLLLLELTGSVSSTSLHVLGGTLVLSRILHAIGLMARSPLAAAGAGLTYLVEVAVAGWAVYLHFVK
jgi:uncharacterized membrane protein YecN with MAPEG domain